MPFSFLYFETGSLSVVQAKLQLVIRLPQSPRWLGLQACTTGLAGKTFFNEPYMTNDYQYLIMKKTLLIKSIILKINYYKIGVYQILDYFTSLFLPWTWRWIYECVCIHNTHTHKHIKSFPISITTQNSIIWRIWGMLWVSCIYKIYSAFISPECLLLKKRPKHIPQCLWGTSSYPTIILCIT